MADAIDKGRRALFQVIPAAGLAALSVPASAAASDETPVSRAYREWKAFRNWLNSADMPDEDYDALCDDRRGMERAMFALPSADLRDAALKLMAFTDEGRDFTENHDGTGARLLGEMGAMAGVAA